VVCIHPQYSIYTFPMWYVYIHNTVYIYFQCGMYTSTMWYVYKYNVVCIQVQCGMYTSTMWYVYKYNVVCIQVQCGSTHYTVVYDLRVHTTNKKINKQNNCLRMIRKQHANVEAFYNLKNLPIHQKQ